MKRRITVYDYRYDNRVDKMTVDAECVGGEDGVFAVFEYPNHVLIGLATGDDGHWQLMATYSKTWIPKIIDALKDVV